MCGAMGIAAAEAGSGRFTSIMCGRFIITSAPEAIRRMFGYAGQPNFPARYNIAPTQPVPVVMPVNGIRQMLLMRWGLIPAWVKDPRGFSLLINARAETVVEKPAFRNAIRRRRCLVPADGYYEWAQPDSSKRPFLITPSSGESVAFAAIAETWMGPNGEEVDTVAIITTAASPDLMALHHRMPAVIAPEKFGAWLDCLDTDLASATAMLASPPQGTFRWYEVSNAVNRTANDSAALLEPITEAQRAAEAMPPKRTARTNAVASAAKVVKRRGGDEDQGSLF
jgi:putative SOS response-associated peptidase YedK